LDTLYIFDKFHAPEESMEEIKSKFCKNYGNCKRCFR